MQSQTRRTLDGLLVIGPHPLDEQLRALAAYAGRAGYALEVVWVLLPGEDPSTDAPDSRFPILAFDDEIAGFTAEEVATSGAGTRPEGDESTDWHVAHTVPQPKRPTTHLPVFGCPAEGETAADALLCKGAESLDLQLARLEAFALRSALRIRGVYLACDPENLRVLLRDFRACNRALGTGLSLTVGPTGRVQVHH